MLTREQFLYCVALKRELSSCLCSPSLPDSELDVSTSTSPSPSSLWGEGHTGCVLAVEEDDLYQPVPCQGSSADKTLAMLAQGSSASKVSQVSFDELYITCPRSRSSTGRVMGNEVLSEAVVCPSPPFSPEDLAHNQTPTSEIPVTLPEVSAQPHSTSLRAEQPLVA